MANLATNDKQVLEKLFQMSSGYVLNFSDKTFGQFFRDDVRVDIFSPKYNHASGSKANRMRGFWQVADDSLVGLSIEKLIAYVDTQILLGNLKREDYPEDIATRARDIATRLQGKTQTSYVPKEDEFITRQFRDVAIEKLGLDSAITVVLNQRIGEIKTCLSSKAPLAVIFLCGSTLEGILLGFASVRPKEFNQSLLSPKDKNQKVKQFHEWSLNDFINVARDLDFVGEDVKKFSHALRDFRNYIHPYEQMMSKFDPDEHTATICWQVLQAAITQLAQSATLSP